MSFLNFKTQKRFVTSAFSFTSTSYIDWKDAPAGNTCSITITKGDGSDIIIRGQIRGRVATANGTVQVGAKVQLLDGSGTPVGSPTTYDLGTNRFFSAATTNITGVAGRFKVPGLAAGSYRIDLQVKTSGGTVTCAATESAYISAYECNGTTGYAADAASVVASSVQTLSSTTYADLPTGGSALTCTITKATATSLLEVHQELAWIGNGGATVVIETAVAVSGADTKVGHGVGNSSWYHFINGRVTLSGVPAGSVTLTFRYKRTTADGQFNTATSASMEVLELEPT